MTDAERRIVAFLTTSDATEPADLPDWLLALLEGDGQDELSHELIITAALLYARRLHPGISVDAAHALMADYAADPARLDELCERMMAFRLSCCLERLKRAGWLEDVLIDDPFDPQGVVSVTLTEARWQSVNPASTPRAAASPRSRGVIPRPVPPTEPGRPEAQRGVRRLLRAPGPPRGGPADRRRCNLQRRDG